MSEDARSNMVIPRRRDALPHRGYPSGHRLLMRLPDVGAACQPPEAEKGERSRGSEVVRAPGVTVEQWVYRMAGLTVAAVLSYLGFLSLKHTESPPPARPPVEASTTLPPHAYAVTYYRPEDSASSPTVKVEDSAAGIARDAPIAMAEPTSGYLPATPLTATDCGQDVGYRPVDAARYPSTGHALPLDTGAGPAELASASQPATSQSTAVKSGSEPFSYEDILDPAQCRCFPIR